jgi:hypothetical protein
MRRSSIAGAEEASNRAERTRSYAGYFAQLLRNVSKLRRPRFVLGVKPDLRIEIRADVLKEEDGPMLQHGLQGFHGATLIVPQARHLQPNRDYLAERYETFCKV